MNNVQEKIGIIDVGGGMRGIYGAGVFDYLLDNEIYIPYCIGISAGSANVGSYISRQKGRNIRFYEKYSFEKDYMSFRNLRKIGSYINLNYVYGTLSNDDGKDPWDYDTAMKSSSNMVVVVSNAQTGKPEYIYKKDFIRNDYGMFSASSCIPLVCKPYEWHGTKYFDGSITDPIPVKKAFEDGCTKVIVILTRPEDYRKSDGKKTKLYKKIKKEYPVFYEKLYNRCELYNNTLEDILKNLVPTGNILIVAPDNCCGMDTLTKDVSKMHKLYEKGYEDGEKIQLYLKNVAK